MAFLFSRCFPRFLEICSLLRVQMGEKRASRKREGGSRFSWWIRGPWGSCFNTVRNSERAIYGVLLDEFFLTFQRGISIACTGIDFSSWGLHLSQLRIIMINIIFWPWHVLSTLHVLIHLFITRSLWGMYYYPCFAEEPKLLRTEAISQVLFGLL